MGANLVDLGGIDARLRAVRSDLSGEIERREDAWKSLWYRAEDPARTIRACLDVFAEAVPGRVTYALLREGFRSLEARLDDLRDAEDEICALRRALAIIDGVLRDAGREGRG